MKKKNASARKTYSKPSTKITKRTKNGSSSYTVVGYTKTGKAIKKLIRGLF